MRSYPFARLGAALLFAAAMPALAADGPQPGLWKVTIRAETDGAPAPERISNRCLKPEQLKDIEKTFTPEQGAACTRVEFEWTGRKLSWRIKCTAPVAMDNSGWYVFDSPRHYTGELVVGIAAAAGREMISRTRIEGEHLGECPN